MQPTKTLEHWDPVIKVWDKGLTIVSLNYDTVIEKRCAELELAIDASIAGEKDLPIMTESFMARLTGCIKTQKES